MRNRHCTIPIALAALMVLPGCAAWSWSPGGVQVWAVPDSATVLPGSPPEPENEVFSQTSRVIRLEAAINEVASFQLALRAEGGPASVRTLVLDELRQGPRTIAVENAQFYRASCIPVSDYPAWYLRLTPELRRRREYPDLLIPFSAPRGALPINLEPNRVQSIWVDLRVPSGTEPGLYRSKLHVILASGISQTFDLVLICHPFFLPHSHHLPIIVGVDTGTLLRHHLEVDGRPYAPKRLTFDDPVYERAARIIDETVRLLHEHRCGPMLTDIQPMRRVGPDGRLELDWTDYDRLVTTILDGTAFEDRVPVAAWPMPIDDEEPAPELYGGWGSPRYEQMLVDYLRQCVAHFQQAGWLDRHFVWMPVPGSSRDQRYRQFEWLGTALHKTDPLLAVVCTLSPQSLEPFGLIGDPFRNLSPHVGIWCPPAWQADPDALAAQRGAGRRTWLHPDRPPYSGSLSAIAPAVHARSLAWQAHRFGCEAILVPAANDWPDDGVPSAEASLRSLVWPGKPYGLDRPIPSIRLKRLLRGAQDYEYLWLLERNRRPAVANLIAADLFPFGGTGAYGEHCLDAQANGWAANPEAWALARSLMAKELILAMEAAGSQGGNPGDADAGRVARFDQQLQWRRHTEMVRQVRMNVEGVRVRLDPQRPSQPIRVEATVSIFNATRGAYTGSLEFTDLPEGWTAEPSTRPIDQLGPARATIRQIRAYAPSIQANLEGTMPIHIQRKDADGTEQGIAGRLCALTAHRLEEPIVMDGRLDEWPTGTTNVAGDFILVGALDVPKEGRPSPDRASQQTFVYLGNDSEYLYIAFDCQDDRMSDRVFTRSNQVRYDDLWPMDEDLIEVVLDPSGEAVLPGDLLHIVVKANGAVITERGAPCLAPIGGYGDWPAEVTATIDDSFQPNRWSVEIRVPLKSLGKPAAVWGVNFARFQARLGEYSSWSGARRYVYSPASLGNMRLGR